MSRTRTSFVDPGAGRRLSTIRDSRLAFLALAMLAAPVDAESAKYEPAPVFKASEILPPELLRGERYEVVERVENDGYMNTYRIASDFGRFDAYGQTLLVARVLEIEALDELDKVSKTDVFLDAAGDAVAAPVKAVERLVEDPEETLKQIPKGVGRMFKRLGRAAKHGR